MPLFGAKKKKDGEEELKHGNCDNGTTTAPVSPNSPLSIHRLSFPCQLSHGSSTMHISGFTSMRQLYEKIAEAFSIQTCDLRFYISWYSIILQIKIKVNCFFMNAQILYCTLNTHKVNMNCLLGGQIGLDDFIFVHCKGQTKEIEITKIDEFLGLTITDNGNGYSFVKKIKDGSLVDNIKFIEVGDVIEKINGRNLVGSRHFEVAKALRDIKVALIGPRENGIKKAHFGSGKETLRLSANGPPVVEETVDKSEQMAIQKINALLESFMGIHDNELSIQIWMLGKGINNPHDFLLAIENSDLEVFGFSDEFVFDLWGAISDARITKIQ
ncbi:PDZ domain-containing protein GIPC1-like protein [Leptotrombidium deliense]|uniref:PDZ domain-containing protein GIPC1-like protein n=1 Tax=Leptotrombidium deliense TaxID=299467 RepID=A0A443SBK6_9ACAR|nr:PDZ domain-containing protein GIPC1-like protein [Leptotrombidium deliense]